MRWNDWLITPLSVVVPRVRISPRRWDAGTVSICIPPSVRWFRTKWSRTVCAFVVRPCTAELELCLQEHDVGAAPGAEILLAIIVRLQLYVGVKEEVGPNHVVVKRCQSSCMLAWIELVKTKERFPAAACAIPGLRVPSQAMNWTIVSPDVFPCRRHGPQRKLGFNVGPFFADFVDTSRTVVVIADDSELLQRPQDKAGSRVLVVVIVLHIDSGAVENARKIFHAICAAELQEPPRSLQADIAAIAGIVASRRKAVDDG